MFGFFFPPPKPTGFPCDGCPEKNAPKTQWVVDRWLCEKCLDPPEPGVPERVDDDITKKISYSVNLNPDPFFTHELDCDMDDDCTCDLTDQTLD